MLTAQVQLKPSIGLSALPADADPICAIPTYLGDFDTTGLDRGDTLADFTLYDVNGTAVNLATELAAGKPILLVNGSYTCPVFRGRIDEINAVISSYPNDLKVFVIYTVEAHPAIDISPYFGAVNTSNYNQQAGILYRQPTTYGERKAVVADLLDSLPINAPVLIDGPCNEWWSHYGPAPNNAYLVDTNGIVFKKHPWFDKYPNDIFCDIDSLLGTPTPCGTTANGDFQFYLTSPATVEGATGTTLSATANLVNTGSGDVIILMKKLMVDLPSDWSASICTDVCYPSSVDSATFYLEAGDTQKYTMYFYTGLTPDTGRVRMGFRNENTPQNNFMQVFTGITDTLMVGHSPVLKDEEISFYPSPFTDELHLELPASGKYTHLSLVIWDMQGRRYVEMPLLSSEVIQLDTRSWPKGIYAYLITGVITGAPFLLNRGKVVKL